MEGKIEMTEKKLSQLLRNNLNKDFVSDLFAKEKLDESILEKYIGYFDEFYQFEKIACNEVPEDWWIEFVENEFGIEELWDMISIFQELSEEFIERHSNEVDWYFISIHQELSESFIERYFDKIDWFWISKHQKLSESFIEKHSDKVDWGMILIFQKLSDGFIKKHSKEVY